ncbi:MAG: hypothetical protein P1U56_07015 [Saprospiraceae bacterium]|nr:hypothetical protein [Saprospiraceae bacterium]
MNIPTSISEYFLFFIQSLRKNELLAMHGHFVPLSVKDETVIQFLHIEFEEQKIALPETDIKFDKEAAYWAATFVYNCAQLMLNRSDVLEKISQYLKQYDGEVNQSSIISADLCLRFLPDIIEKLIEIDQDDPIISQLLTIGNAWPYSMIPICKKEDEFDLTLFVEDQWLLQIFSERVAKFHNTVLMKVPAIENYYKAELGIYKNQLLK